MRKLNPIFLSGLLAVSALLGGLAYVVHGYQVLRNAEALLDRARKAEQEGNLSKATEALRGYLDLTKDNAQNARTWPEYARVLDELFANRPGRVRERVLLVYEEALRHNPDDSKLERRCADLALELSPKRTIDARRHLKKLADRAQLRMKEVPGDSGARLELAELEEMLGVCDVLESRFEAAAASFGSAIEHDPRRLSCYDQRARLLRGELRKNPEEAKAEIKRMVENNPESGRALLYRFRYQSEFHPPADGSDLKQALELAPEDPQVLLTAAQVAGQKKDLVAARAYLEKGRTLDPEDPAVPIELARLETDEQHLDRAEAVLRQAYKDKPTTELAFLLAETLIVQDKIEGKDQANEYITVLRDGGFGETLVRYLEARIAMQQKNWNSAIPKIESARAVLKSDPQLSTQLNLMLAECYTRLDSEEQRLAALRQAGEGPAGSEAARIELARALARSGELDQALKIMVPLAERQPKFQLDIVRLLIQKNLRLPGSRRNWLEVEIRLKDAAAAQPGAIEALTLLRVDLLAAQEKWQEARTLLTLAQSKDPRNLPYRLALARLAQRQGQGALALQILDQAEKDLGLSLGITLTRLDSWARRGGAEAKAAVAKLAEDRKRLPAKDLPALLDQLAETEIRMGDPGLARTYLRELASLQQDNQRALLLLFELALEANDQTDAQQLVDQIRKVEGEGGTKWRFAQAACLIDQARRGDTKRLEAASTLASEIADRRPNWWGAPLLNAQIAELQDRPDDALTGLRRAVELGDFRPTVIRRLVVLLHQRNQFDEIDKIAQTLGNRGIALEDLTIVNAINALRKKDFGQAIALARKVFSDTSTGFSDHLALGRFLFAAGQVDEAGKEFKRAVDLGPSVPDTWLSYVQYLAQTKQVDQAKAALEAARKALPADQSALTLAQCSMMVGDANQAEKFLQSALKQKPIDPKTLRLAATFYVGQGRTDQVEPILAKLLDAATKASQDDLAWANRTRGLMLLTTGQSAGVDQALRLVKQNLKSNPLNLDDRRLQAVLLAMRSSHRGEAIEILEPLDSSNLLGADLQFLLAQLYLGERDEVKYRGEMLKILDRKIKNPQHLAHYISFLVNRKQLDQASRWLALLKEVEPQGLRALELEAGLLNAGNRDRELLELLETRRRQIPDQIGPVAGLLDRFGFVHEAEGAYKAFIAREPKDQERVLALAEHMAVHDRPREAIELYEKARTTCRPEAVARAALPILGAPSANETQKGLVEAWLIEAIQKRPDLVILQGKLAVLRMRQNRCDEAETIYRRILSSAPDYTEALNNLAWLLALQDPAKTQEALELINRAIEIQGPIAYLVDTRAVVLVRGGKLDQAIQELSNAQAIDSRNPNIAFHLAWAYQESGHTDQARDEFRKARTLGLKPGNCDPVERSLFEKLRHDLGQ